MTGALILWGHALAALAFGVLGLDQARSARVGWPRGWFVAALVATACWALAVAGIDARDLATRLAEGVRNLAWLGFMYAAVRRDAAGGTALAAVYAMAAAMALAIVALALIGVLHLDGAASAAVTDARVLCRIVGAIAALILLLHLDGSASDAARARVTPLVVALAMMWSADIVIVTLFHLLGDLPQPLVAMRGFVMTLAAFLLVLAARRGSDSGSFRLSRVATMRALLAFGLCGYVLVTIGLTLLAGHLAPAAARIAQTAIVVAAAVALATLLSTPWLRAWAKVKVAKHLFSHRYDYRSEWQRFTTTLGVPGPGADPLDRRIVKAIADLTDSPAGLLLVPDGEGLGAGAAWRWAGHEDAGPALAAYLTASGRIVELDAVRAGAATDAEAGAIPCWMRARDDAWALVPLLHGSTLVGAILLARPPIDRALDWEDLDLLRIAGRQAASYLAEERAQTALSEAARFDEFNRRFAFIIHDIKNLVSGLTLVARNAERHADNPDFRADMIATLQDSAVRMNALLARLSQHHHSAAEPPSVVDVAALAARIATARRAQHPIVATGEGIALVPAARLEQMLCHLVQNAIEASAPDAPVEIVVATHAGAVTIDVIDTGCGMSPAFVRDELFRPFASSKAGGFGIGAYEARQLVMAMGGSIEVTSEEGAGTRFRLTLPAAVAMEAAA